MPSLLRVPRLYPEMEEATVGRWFLAAGEKIRPGVPVVEIITDKVAYEVEAPEEAEGMSLLTACTAERSVIPVGAILAVFGVPGEGALPDWRQENEALQQGRREALSGGSGQRSDSAVASPPPPVAGESGGPIRATPAARRAAKAAGVTLEEIAAAASGSTVTESDVQRYLESRQ